MSKPRAKAPTNSLARYRSEVKGTPFVLWVDDDEQLEIPRPSTNRMLAAEKAYNEGGSRDVIEALCGDKSERLLEAIGDDDVEVLFRIIGDMREHFGLGE